MKESLITTLAILISTIYSFSVTGIDGTAINFSDFQGKKVLIVNTASNSSQVDQYGQLEKLYQLYKDSLVIVAIPSNNFGNEPGNNEAIKSFVMDNYHIHYLLAAKMDVTDSTQSPLYSWLTDKTQNEMMNNRVKNDFTKFLIDSSGRLIGFFDGSVDPMTDEMTSAISR